MKLFRGFTFCAVLFLSSFCGLEASLKSYFVDELCYETSKVVFGLMSADSGVVQFLATSNEPVDCEILWRSGYKISPVLSIVSYNLHPNDELIITDSDRFSVKLVGNGFFPDERKAFVSDGDLTVRFKSNHTQDNRFDKVKFQFVYTMARKGPCSFNEYECRNGKCIDENLVCDSHNHCGDRSDQKKCGLVRENIDVGDSEYVISRQTAVAPFIIVVASVIIFILIIVIIALAVRLRKKSQAALPTVDATVTTVPREDQPAKPSVFTVLRNSIRSKKNPNAEVAMNEQQRSESYQVPSMYPQIPSAPDLSGVENRDFKAEE